MNVNKVDRTATSYEAKTHLPALLRQVEQGRCVLITRRGKPIAKLIPAEQAQTPDIGEVMERIKEFRKKHAVHLEPGESWRNFVEEGRRF